MNVCMKISTKIKLCQVIIYNGVQVLVIFTEALILYLNRRIIGHVKKYQIYFQTNLANRPGFNLAKMVFSDKNYGKIDRKICRPVGRLRRLFNLILH